MNQRLINEIRQELKSGKDFKFVESLLETVEQEIKGFFPEQTKIEGQTPQAKSWRILWVTVCNLCDNIWSGLDSARRALKGWEVDRDLDKRYEEKRHEVKTDTVTISPSKSSSAVVWIGGRKSTEDSPSVTEQIEVR